MLKEKRERSASRSRRLEDALIYSLGIGAAFDRNVGESSVGRVGPSRSDGGGSGGSNDGGGRKSSDLKTRKGGSATTRRGVRFEKTSTHGSSRSAVRKKDVSKFGRDGEEELKKLTIVEGWRPARKDENGLKRSDEFEKR